MTVGTTEIILGTSSIRAAVDLVAHRFIGFGGNLCAANARARGVSATRTRAGQMCPINIAGEVLVEAGGTVAVGNPVVSDATGRAVIAAALTATTPAGATAVTSNAAQPVMTIAGGVLPQEVLGYATEAGTVGAFIRISLK